MMLSHPVLLGFLWSLFIHSLSGQPQISSQETNKVYAYSYHFQHNGTTNSQDILRRVLGTDPEFGIDPSDDQSIIKTFSSPSIRGFFTKGILPVGPINQNYNSGFNSRFNTNSALNNIKKVVEANLQPPNREIATGLLPPISPDIANEFPGDYNNGNDIGLNFQKQDDFPKIPPPPPPFSIQNNFPKIPSPPLAPEIDFPKIPDPPQTLTNDNGISRVESFSRDTPDGGKIEGEIETFSYNPPPISNSNSNYQENSHGFRRSENFQNSNQGVTGHRTQTYFRQQFRTVTPNLETNNLNQNNRIDNGNTRSNYNSNNLNQNNRIDNGNTRSNYNSNNQWWNVLNVLGDNRNNNNNNHNTGNLEKQIEQNINKVQSNLNNQLNSAFGSRLSAFNNRQNNNYNENRQNNNYNENRQNGNNGYNNGIHNFNNNRNFRNQPNVINPFSNRIDSSNTYNTNPNNNVRINNNVHNTKPINNNNRINSNVPFQNLQNNNVQNNLNNKFNNDGTTKEVLNIINGVNAQLNNLNNNPGNRNNNLRLTWDDDITPNINLDWSRRQSRGNGRPFSNAHSGPLSMLAAPNPVEALKSTIENIVGGREYQVPSIPDIGNQGGNYRNVGGGGIEKFFGVDKVVEGPNSYSRNQHRGFERNIHVNSNSGYQRNNQWSTNTLRRLDAQSSRADFSKDFIDVFRDDY